MVRPTMHQESEKYCWPTRDNSGGKTLDKIRPNNFQ